MKAWLFFRYRAPWVTVVGAYLLSACGTVSPPAEHKTTTDARPSVDIAMLANPAEAAYVIEPGDSYLAPTPHQDNALPKYPANLLGLNLPTALIEIRLVVSEDGDVKRCEVTKSDNSHPDFQSSVLAAVSTWRFSPLKRIRMGLANPMPTTLGYRFIFRQQNGQPSVESSVH